MHDLGCSFVWCLELLKHPPPDDLRVGGLKDAQSQIRRNGPRGQGGSHRGKKSRR